MRPLPDTFSRLQRALHWGMVALIATNLALPQAMGGRGLALGVFPSEAQHIVIGCTVMALAVLRLLLRLTRGVPPEPLGAPRVFRVLARLGQWVFYALFFTMPLSGLLSYYLDDPTARLLHAEILRPLFCLLIAVHVCLALAHQFVWRTDMLGKIIRG